MHSTIVEKLAAAHLVVVYVEKKGQGNSGKHCDGCPYHRAGAQQPSYNTHNTL